MLSGCSSVSTVFQKASLKCLLLEVLALWVLVHLPFIALLKNKNKLVNREIVVDIEYLFLTIEIYFSLLNWTFSFKEITVKLKLILHMTLNGLGYWDPAVKNIHCLAFFFPFFLPSFLPPSFPPSVPSFFSSPPMAFFFCWLASTEFKEPLMNYGL